AHAKPDFRLVVASSDRVFRPLGAADAAFDDFTPYDSATPDGAAEASCALLAKAWGRSFNIPVVMTHSPQVYGPWQRKTALLPSVIRHALSGGPIALDDGETVRDWLHVADLANGLVAAAARGAPGATYLFGARSERRVLDVVLAICTLLDAKRPRADGQSYGAAIQSSEDLVGVGLRFGADPTHAEQALDWRAQYGLHLGLSELVDWVLSQSGAPARKPIKPELQPAAQAAE
ncbi:MAG: NAD-dependent epimerase/dehydratase family protein, partial [Pseudomonadota bacterium]